MFLAPIAQYRMNYALQKDVYEPIDSQRTQKGLMILITKIENVRNPTNV